jgi:hypothetical protein
VKESTTSIGESSIVKRIVKQCEEESKQHEEESPITRGGEQSSVKRKTQ